MKKSSPGLDLSRLVRTPEVSDQDREMLRDLSSTLVTHNFEQSNTLLVTKDGYPDSTNSRWKEMRRKDSLRIYRERPSSARSDAPFTPSLLLLGTVDGTVDDIMYGVVAATDSAMKIKSTCVQDGMLDSKVLHELVEPSMDDPFRHVGVKWRLYNGRDYVSLDATGVLHTAKRDRVGYNLSHSVGFADIPSFEEHGVMRGNMSVCSIYRQKTPTTVECYVRGFFDFPTKNEMLNNLALQALASQWLSFARKVECGQMKKLVWRLRKNSLGGRSSDGSSTSTCSSYGSAPSPRSSPSMRPGACALCYNSFGFLGTSRETCKSCMQSVCVRCVVKKMVCVMAPDKRTVLEKKRSFCLDCLDDVAEADALAVAREELSFDRCEEETDEFLPRVASSSSLYNMQQRTKSIPIPKRIGRSAY
ncbi:hypothetical protein BBJ28_00013485 [Nothophytophthora sp. Chile5]|nr:hypothetical protein BBJ28_00013485 [Nothophytophthora sp. Chile5]